MDIARILYRGRRQILLLVVFVVIIFVLLFAFLISRNLRSKKSVELKPSGVTSNHFVLGATESANKNNDKQSLNVIGQLSNNPSPLDVTGDGFLEKEGKLLSDLRPVRFDRSLKISENNKEIREEKTTFFVKSDKVRAEYSADTIIVNSGGCFRIEKSSQKIYKYVTPESLENCKNYTRWNGDSWEHFKADPNFKVLGQQVLQGVSVTLVQAQLTIPKFNISFLSKYSISDENGLTMLVEGVSDNKKLTGEYTNFDFASIDEGIFTVSAGNITDSSDLF